MFVDAREMTKGAMVNSDVCIIGAGAAGITLAQEFSRQSFQVCLLESGGLNYDEETQALYKGENTGHDYFPLDEARLRWFGGTTNHWAGNCRPLHDIDFEERDWVPNSGWPFGRTELDPYYQRATAICQIGPFNFEPEAWGNDKMSQLNFLRDHVKTQINQFSPPTRFGYVYRETIEQASNITSFLHANVVQIDVTKSDPKVTRVKVACLNGTTFWLTAKTFVLAAGAIENPRLLLQSNEVQKNGIGNHADLVGRYFMEHLGAEIGYLVPSNMDPTSFDLYEVPERRINPSNREGDIRTRAYLMVSDKIQRENKMLNVSVIVNRPWAHPATDSDGYESMRNVLSDPFGTDSFLEHLGNVVRDIDNVATGLYWKVFEQDQMMRYYRVRIQTEQAPNPDSRVTLSSERDSLGMNRVNLNWQLSSIDLDTIRKLARIVGVEFGHSGLGRFITLVDDNDDVLSKSIHGSWHHMGTTRMHPNPQKGVVDEQCRVHGVSNLFVAGSSVFPTGGHSVPTFTIVALSLRLADHIKRMMI